MHFSHLHRYVSAYETNPATSADLEIAVLEAYLRLRGKGGTEHVDQDGEMQFEVCAGGVVRLMLPWRSFEMEVEATDGTRKHVRELSVEDIHEHLAGARERRAAAAKRKA